MSHDAVNPLAPERVCDILTQKGLLSEDQAKNILKNELTIRKKLEKEDVFTVPGVPIHPPVTIIDVIASLHLKRADNKVKLLDEETLYYVMSQEWNIPYKKIDPLKLDLNFVTTTIPRGFSMRHLILPISMADGMLTIATNNPFNMEALEDIARVSPYKVEPVISPKSDIIKLINEFYGFKRSIAEAEIQFSTPGIDLGNLEQYTRLKRPDELQSTDQHIVNAVNHLFIYGFDQRASDIHIEPKRDVTLVRFRIDGVLHTVFKLPKKVHAAILSRIKNLSRLDMTEKRRPQDGRIKMDKGDMEVEIRVSTIPVAFGEKVVMRIMNPEILLQDMETLGFTNSDLIRYNKLIKMPHGIVLVTGPTGSGKSTTLYSTLRSLSTPEINITTVEEPIEMIHEDFNQIAVQPGLNISFGSILRNILRQDPDIIMIGEMRDMETAENAIQAALTGHLVLSTLHTNDAPSSITRLIDLGVPSFLIQSTLVGIIAQRLVRKICPDCTESFTMHGSELKSMGLDVGKDELIKLTHGKGCMKCRHTGYYGRAAIFEVMTITDSIKKLITSHVKQEAIKALACKEGMVRLRQNAIKKMIKGETTYQEVLRVTWEQD